MPGEVTETRHPIERRDPGDGDLEPPEWARRRIADYHLPPQERRRREQGGQ